MNILDAEKIFSYKFSDKQLFLSALTHSSFANENNVESNERLEFLGDSVLSLAIAEQLYVEGANEGDMSKKRALIVSREPLAKFFDDAKLINHVLLGNGMKATVLSTKSKSDFIEAVIGAIYLDGGFKVASEFIKNKLMRSYASSPDYKTEFQEMMALKKQEFSYNTYAYEKGFKCELTFGDKTFIGVGETKRASEMQAASYAIKALKK